MERGEYEKPRPARRRPLFIYHADCADGFTAAWAAWVRHPYGVFHGAAPGSKPPGDNYMFEQDVYIMDFCYSRDEIISMAQFARSITVIDHHKTSMEALEGFPTFQNPRVREAQLQHLRHGSPIEDRVSVQFDMKRSGCRLAWEYFHPEEGMPPIVSMVEDYDLWRFAFPDTRELMAYVSSLPKDFSTWSDLDQMLTEPGPREGARAAGNAINRKQVRDIENAIEAGSYMRTLHGHNVPWLNVPPAWTNDAGHIMAQKHPFAVCYWDTPSGRRFSLRRHGSEVDVSAIAKEYGGGGHASAAGFTVPPNHHLANR